MSSTLISSYNFYINSSQRNSGVQADFNIILATPLFLNGTVPSEFRFELRYIQVPFCFSQFNQFNFTTEYILTRNGIVYNSSFDIAIGNYNINSFLTEWINKLKTSLQAVAGYNPVITATYSADTNLCTITLPADTFPDTAILFDNTTNKAVNLAIGFRSDWTLIQGTSTVSQIDINVSPSRNLYLLSDSLIQSKSYDALTTPISNTNILSVIPINVTPNNFITLYYNPPVSSTLNNAVIDTLNFQLKDESLTRDLVDFDLDYTIYFVIEEHRTFRSTEMVQNFRMAPEMQVSGLAPPTEQEQQVERRREGLLRAREKLSKRLLQIKNELENKITSNE
jgi:hypothetical protein